MNERPLLWMVIVSILGIMLTMTVGCDPEGDELRSDIARTLVTFKDAIDHGSRPSLNEVVSERYEFAGLNKAAFIDSVLGQRVTLNGSSLQRIELNEAKDAAIVKVEWRSDGMPTIVHVPIFQQEVTMAPTVYTDARFALRREDGKIWRIVQMEERSKTAVARTGDTPPRITLCEVTPEMPRPGEALEVRLRIARAVEGEAVFLAVNGVPLGSYTQSGLPASSLNDTFLQVFRVPEGQRTGSRYPVEIVVAEGKVDPMQLSLSELTGVEYRNVQVPVR